VEALRDWRRTVIRENKIEVNDLHPTMKPVNLVRRLILDGSLPGQTVYDPFAGSGTTIMACDLVGRHCRAVEQEPAHCDTIIRRYLALDTSRRVRRIRGDADTAPIDVTDEFRAANVSDKS
jgi:DNA modification methylase